MDELATISDALRSAAPEAGALERDLLDMLDQLDVHAQKEQEVIFPEGWRLLRRWRGDTGEAEAPQPPPSTATATAGEAERPSILFRALRRFARLVR